MSVSQITRIKEPTYQPVLSQLPKQLQVRPDGVEKISDITIDDDVLNLLSR